MTRETLSRSGLQQTKGFCSHSKPRRLQRFRLFALKDPKPLQAFEVKNIKAFEGFKVQNEAKPVRFRLQFSKGFNTGSFLAFFLCFFEIKRPKFFVWLLLLLQTNQKKRLRLSSLRNSFVLRFSAFKEASSHFLRSFFFFPLKRFRVAVCFFSDKPLFERQEGFYVIFFLNKNVFVAVSFLHFCFFSVSLLRSNERFRVSYFVCRTNLCLERRQVLFASFFSVLSHQERFRVAFSFLCRASKPSKSIPSVLL